MEGPSSQNAIGPSSGQVLLSLCILALSTAAHVKGILRVCQEYTTSEDLDQKRKEVLAEQHKPFCMILIYGLCTLILVKYSLVLTKAVMNDTLTSYDPVRMLVGGLFLTIWSVFQLGYFRLNMWRIKLLALFVHLLIMTREAYRDGGRQSLGIAARITAGLALMDHRQAVLLQCCLVWVRVTFKDETYELDIFADDVMTVALMWVIWFAVQTCLKQCVLMTQTIADAKATLEAVRALLSSQCDAEACLSSTLIFQDPSSKLAHFLGCKVEQLQGQSFDEFVAEKDQPRFRSLIDSSVQAMQLGQPHHALVSTVSLSVGHRQIEVNLRLCSVPALQLDTRFFLLALNLVRDDVPDAPSDDDAVSQGDSSPSDVSPPQGAAASGDQLAPLSKHLHFSGRKGENTNVFSSVSVIFDSRTMEISDLKISLSIGSWKQSERTFLKNCIVDDVWPGFSSWLKSWGQGHVGPNVPPPIVLFKFPRLLRRRGVLAARHSDLKKCRGEDGRPTGETCLRLRDIRLRNVLQRGKTKKAPPESMASQESLCGAAESSQRGRP